MGLLDYFTNRKKTKKGEGLSFGKRFQQLFLDRVGIVNTYDDNIRTYIESGYQQNPVVFSAVNMIAKNVAKAKWKCVNAKGEVIQVPLLSQLLSRPNPLQKWSDLNEALATHYLLEGNSFLTGEYGSGINAAKFNHLYVLPTEEIQVVTNNGKSIQGFRVDHSYDDVAQIPASDVLWMRASNPDFDQVDNWLFGQSPFRAALQQIQTYNEAQSAALWFQHNKGAQKALFTKGDMEMSPEAVDQFKNKLREQAQGAKNSGNIPIIDGELGTIDISANAKDAILLEQMNYSAQQICNVINFPSQLIGLKDATYQNAKEAKKALWENCVIPMLEELKNGYNAWLTPQYGNVWLEYDLSHIDSLQEDKLDRFDLISKGAGLLTINQALAMAGEPTYDWMKPPTNMEEFKEQLYLGFVQGVVSDTDNFKDSEQGEQAKPTKEDKQ